MPELLIISAISGDDGESGTGLFKESAAMAESRAEGAFIGSGPHQLRREQRRRAPALRA
jgi:hypothetical protein